MDLELVQNVKSFVYLLTLSTILPCQWILFLLSCHLRSVHTSTHYRPYAGPSWELRDHVHGRQWRSIRPGRTMLLMSKPRTRVRKHWSNYLDWYWDMLQLPWLEKIQFLSFPFLDYSSCSIFYATFLVREILVFFFGKSTRSVFGKTLKCHSFALTLIGESWKTHPIVPKFQFSRWCPRPWFLENPSNFIFQNFSFSVMSFLNHFLENSSIWKTHLYEFHQ